MNGWLSFVAWLGELHALHLTRTSEGATIAQFLID